MDLRQHAMRYVGQPIVAHHVNGTVYRGILHSVTPDGMYIRNMGYASADHIDHNFNYTDFKSQDNDLEAESVFFGGGFGFGMGFIPWGGLAGFWGGGLFW